MSKYSPFSLKHFDRYKAKVSHVTYHVLIKWMQTWKGNCMPSFTKMRKFFPLEIKKPLNSWLSQVEFSRIHNVFQNFHSGERVKKFRIRMLDSPAGFVLAVAVSEKKKLRIQKYPDTFGRDQSCVAREKIYILILSCT